MCEFLLRYTMPVYPGASPGTDNPPARPSRHIPSDVKRVVSKRDADQCAFDGDCGELGCGLRMPRDGNMPLPVANRDQIRRWIVQGAGDN